MKKLAIKDLDFKKQNGLIPAVIQDYLTHKVLMLGFMNADALRKTEEEGLVTFYSRSKSRLWTKGESSQNYLYVKDILVDCDHDTVLVKVDPAGPVCHTGQDTCFGETNHPIHFLSTLSKIIKERRLESPEHSYTARLFAKGLNKIAQKVGEEAIEVVIEAKDEDRHLFIGEAADLLYHLLVLFEAKRIDLSEVEAELYQRHVKKTSRPEA